jgi:hypothetical protein
MCTLNQSIYKNYPNEGLEKTSRINPHRLTKPSTTLHPSFHSQKSLNENRNNNNPEQIWIKRRLPNSSIEKIFDRRQPFLWKEIIDVTV